MVSLWFRYGFPIVKTGAPQCGNSPWQLARFLLSLPSRISWTCACRRRRLLSVDPGFEDLGPSGKRLVATLKMAIEQTGCDIENGPAVEIGALSMKHGDVH